LATGIRFENQSKWDFGKHKFHATGGKISGGVLLMIFCCENFISFA
jgi:hypothetical protein